MKASPFINPLDKSLLLLRVSLRVHTLEKTKIEKRREKMFIPLHGTSQMVTFHRFCFFVQTRSSFLVSYGEISRCGGEAQQKCHATVAKGGEDHTVLS